MRSSWLRAAVIGFAVAALVVVLLLRGRDNQASTPAAAGIESVLSGDVAGFAKVSAPRAFEFPLDHGAHPDFRSEWWYLTGNVQSLSGRRFGYQLTVFRNATQAADSNLDASLSTRQYYMAHVALTDVDEQRYFSDEKFARGAAKLAGARSTPFSAWVENWRIDGQTSDACDGCMTMQADVSTDEFTFSFELKPIKPLTLQGDKGYSVKTADGSNASHYYSMTRLATRGFVRIADDRFEVEGLSWYDREWSTSSLGSGQAGWDWFSLQLDDGVDVMLYRMRREDGTSDEASSGTVVDSDGQSQRLDADEFVLTPLTEWTSRQSGSSYPLVWRIEVPEMELELELRPMVDAQEHLGVFRYWEGAVSFSGTRAGVPVTGVGYMELTGYGQTEP